MLCIGFVNRAVSNAECASLGIPTNFKIPLQLKFMFLNWIAAAQAKQHATG